jgi:hypothetical protein
MATRTDRSRAFARSYDHLDALHFGTEAGVLINKTSETMAAVQDRGQFHGAEASGVETSTIKRLNEVSRFANALR